MANGTMSLIQSVTVPVGGQASLEFLNIPQTYSDLQIVFSARTNRASETVDNINIGFNGTTTNLTSVYLVGTASTTVSSTSLNRFGGFATGASATTDVFANTTVYIPNYTNSENKIFSVDSVSETNGTPSYQIISNGLWSQTASITSISLTSNTSDTFQQYSTAYLYGITRIPSGAKATGGVITDTATHWIHTFTSSGVFTPNANITTEYLVIAGGGGGGANGGGGGGAGGYRCSVSGENTGGGGSAEAALSLTANTNYTVTIGAGGTAAPGTSGFGGNGGNSVFSSITSTGGGGGGGGSADAGKSGGSGGGGSAYPDFLAGGTRTASPVQGFDGGIGISYLVSNGTGGGGGAGEAGNTDAQGDGGDGLASSITGTSVFRGGGGAGFNNISGGSAVGGLGGGGNGQVAGTINTGGGGGCRNNQSAAAGGSGIVIIRYAK